MSEISLKTLMKPSMTVSIDFPGMLGFSVELCYLAREELLALRKNVLTKNSIVQHTKQKKL